MHGEADRQTTKRGRQASWERGGECQEPGRRNFKSSPGQALHEASASSHDESERPSTPPPQNTRSLIFAPKDLKITLAPSFFFQLHGNGFRLIVRVCLCIPCVHEFVEYIKGEGKKKNYVLYFSTPE